MPASRESPISPDELMRAVKLIVTHLRAEGKASEADIQQMLSAPTGPSIPVSLFSQELSCLEVVCKHLKENENLTYRQIASHIGRDERTVWTTYRNARKKAPKRVAASSSLPAIPAGALQGKAPLLAISIYLQKSYTIAQIARMLRRPYHTIWATLKRGERR